MRSLQFFKADSNTCYTSEEITLFNYLQKAGHDLIITCSGLDQTAILNSFTKVLRYKLDDYTIILDNDGYILVDSSSDKVVISAINLEYVSKLIAKLESFRLPKEDGKGKVTFCILYLNYAKSLSQIVVSFDSSDFKYIRNDLYPDIDPHILAKEYNESKDNLLIIHGAPGTGKTSYIKHLSAYIAEQKGLINYDNYDNEGKIFYAKDWAVMNNSQFWPKLTEANPSLLILDDLDHALGAKDRSEFVSNLLSFLDGVISRKNNKVVISTNKEIGEIDKALLRSGR